MRILSVLTYYRPHTSGLTIYAERLAQALVRQGHQVTVLTSHFDPSTPREEVQEGVRIVRVPVMFRVSKGVIMPTFGFLAWKLALEHDVIHLHLPQFDAAGVAFRGRLLRKPTVITYHCDLDMAPSLFNRIVNQVVHLMNNLAGMFTHRIAAYTEDFASHSPYLTRFADKVQVITPPVDLPKASPETVASFAAAHNPEGRRPVIGMATRLASEKGVEILLEALPSVIEKYPQTTVLFAGTYQNVMGEEAYFEKLYPTIREYEDQGRWKFLGNLTLAQMAAFYPNLDMVVVPSLNSTETFGFVQIEAMMNGVPAVASNLPGVRQPVTMTGMGEVVPIGDSSALAEAILKILDNPANYQGDPPGITHTFNPNTTAEAFVALWEDLQKELGG